MINPVAGVVFAIEYNGDVVVFEVTHWCDWNSQAHCHSPHGTESDGHFHYAKGRVVDGTTGDELASEAWMSSNACSGHAFCDAFYDTIAFTTNPWEPSKPEDCALPKLNGTCDVSTVELKTLLTVHFVEMFVFAVLQDMGFFGQLYLVGKCHCHVQCHISSTEAVLW